MQQSTGEGRQREFNVDPVVEVLAALAREGVYWPLDALSRVEDGDEFYMRMAREALYAALRYYAVSGGSAGQLEEAVRLVLATIEKRPHFAKELALRALAKSLS